MRCPFCDNSSDRVLDSRPVESAAVVRRRRQCLKCRKRYTTYERVEAAPLVVLKSDGRREPFHREKLREGIARACIRRPISADVIEKLVSEVEIQLQDYVLEIPSREIGEIVLKKLYGVDLVAYVRFASVYRQFQDLDMFMRELKKLMRSHGGRRKDSKGAARLRVAG